MRGKVTFLLLSVAALAGFLFGYTLQFQVSSHTTNMAQYNASTIAPALYSEENKINKEEKAIRIMLEDEISLLGLNESIAPPHVVLADLPDDYRGYYYLPNATIYIASKDATLYHELFHHIQASLCPYYRNLSNEELHNSSWLWLLESEAEGVEKYVLHVKGEVPIFYSSDDFYTNYTYEIESGWPYDAWPLFVYMIAKERAHFVELIHRCPQTMSKEELNATLYRLYLYLKGGGVNFNEIGDFRYIFTAVDCPSTLAEGRVVFTSCPVNEYSVRLTLAHTNKTVWLSFVPFKG